MDIVFGKKWFEKHQSKLLWFLNTPIIKHWFRWCLRINEKGTINQITPNSYTFGGKYIGEDLVEYKTDFRTHDKYSKRLYFAFKPIWWTMHAFDWIALDRVEALTKLSFGFSTLTAYPDAGDPGTTSCDGDILRSGVNETLGTIRAGAGTSVNMTVVTIRATLISSNTTDQYDTVRRAWTLFDTSTLGSSATISSAVLSLWGTTKLNELGSPDLHIGGGTTASNTTLGTGDFANRGTTSFGSVTYASFDATNSAYTDITLNASGISNIQKTGVSIFTEQLSWDILNTTTGITWGSVLQDAFLFRSSDIGGTSNDPKLVVTYTASTDYPLTASVTAYTLTNRNSNINRGWAVIANATAYTLSMVDALISRAHGYIITASTTAYDLVTNSAIITRMWNIATSVTTYTLTTVNVNITRAVLLITSSTAYNLTTKTIRVLKNGMSAIWSNLTKNSASFTNQTKNSSTWTNENKS